MGDAQPIMKAQEALRFQSWIQQDRSGDIMLNDTSAAPSGPGNTAVIPSAETTYQERCQRFEQQRARYHRYSDINANSNVALVISALLFLSLGIWFGGTPFFILAGIFALGFVAAYINLRSEEHTSE